MKHLAKTLPLTLGTALLLGGCLGENTFSLGISVTVPAALQSTHADAFPVVVEVWEDDWVMGYTVLCSPSDEDAEGGTIVTGIGSCSVPSSLLVTMEALIDSEACEPDVGYEDLPSEPLDPVAETRWTPTGDEACDGDSFFLDLSL